MSKCSNKSCKKLEDAIVLWAMMLLIPIIETHGQNGGKRNVPAVFPRIWLERNAAFRHSNGRNAWIEFCLHIDNKCIFIECKNQDTGGTAEQKYLTAVMCARHLNDNEAYVVILEGQGIHRETFEDCEDLARGFREGDLGKLSRNKQGEVKQKEVWVYDLTGAKAWLNQQLQNPLSVG